METNGLGGLIRAARLRRGWTQEELADRLGVKSSYVSQWETGARKWPQEHVRAISETLGLSQVDMAVAAGLIDDPKEPPPPPRIGPDRAALIEAIERDLTESDARVLMVTARAIVDERDARTVSAAEEWINSGPRPAPTTQ